MKQAFTLAEVLITLGIIGVVSAITMPLISANVQKVVLKNQFKKAYSVINNAHYSARYKFGTPPACNYGLDGTVGNYSDCESYAPLFLNELKIVKTCGNNAMANGCIPTYKGQDEIIKENNPDISDDELSERLTGCTNFKISNLKSYPAYILADGIIILPGVSGNGRIASNLILDINGSKGPNKWGYDVFYFYTHSDGSKYLIGNNSMGCAPTEKGGKSPLQMLRDNNL